VPLGPALPDCDVTVALAESLPPGAKVKLSDGGRFEHWFEHLEGQATVHMSTRDGRPAIMGSDTLRYLAGWPDDDTFDRIIGYHCDVLDIATCVLPDGLRVCDTATHRFVFNYTATPQMWHGTRILPAGVHWEPLA